jgi:IclR family transcriptional regulator, KDG regulon repressor
MPKREKNPDQRKYNTFPPVSTTSGSDSVTSSLERATEILLCLGNGINSATEIAAYCEYSVSTVHRLLQNLVVLRWVVQDEISHKYFLGPLVHKLSSNLMTGHRYLILHALKEMSRLSNLTEETITLSALDQFQILKLQDIPSLHNLRIIEADDKLQGQFLGATAKVLLSQLHDNHLKDFLKHLKNQPATADSVVDNDILLEQILEVRRKGYAVSSGERIKGAVCICAAVNNYYCPVAIYIVGPEDRLKSKIDELVTELLASASLIAESIIGAFDVPGGIKMTT